MNQTDHHFSKKLRDLEITPSERANELFRSRMEQISPQKEKPGKYFATAAAVLLALGFLFVLYLNENVMKADTAVVLPKSTEETSEPGTVTAPAAGTSTAEPLPAETGAPTAGTSAAAAPLIIPETPARLASASEPERMPAFKTSQNRMVEKNMVAAEMPVENFRKNLSDLQSLNPEISYRYHSTDLTDFAILDAHSRLELETPEASSIGVPDKATPLLVKVVREVKYVANGERPDLDRAGIKPVATAFAHNQNGLLANESRQIREGIHKFKEIFR